MKMLRDLAALVTVACGLFWSGSAAAQGYGPPPQHHHHHAAPSSQHGRMVAMRAPMPVEYDRAYPYVTSGPRGLFTSRQPVPHYEHHHVRRSGAQYGRRHASRSHAHHNVHAVRRVPAALAPRSRIRSVSIEATGTRAPLGAAAARSKRAGASGLPRVIRAEAEVRIVGNDQMTIRLFRKKAPRQASAN